MNTLDAIRTRRAVKHYDPSHKLTAEELEQLTDLALLSPTAFNIQHWRIVHVEDSALRERIQEVSWNQAQVTEASALFILCADTNAWQKSPERYWRNAPEAVQGFMLPAIDGYYRGNEQTQRDECMRSCGIVAQTLMLAARGMGYDSCPMDGFDFDKVAELIALPEDHLISMFVVVGKAKEEARPRAGQLDKAEVVLKNGFAV
ncbi:UNVERIFIED_CONTAM: hypothetical protein GTU68_043495 [Idotea baltica]|nr:hypothetical protein [Idotea baltica]